MMTPELGSPRITRRGVDRGRGSRKTDSHEPRAGQRPGRRSAPDPRQRPDGALSVRYDAHEKVHGQPLPHLFAHRVGTRWEVLSFDYIRTILLKTAAAARLSDSGPSCSTHMTSDDCSRPT